jgi:ABC-type multidrug transport system ATPase subunit
MRLELKSHSVFAGWRRTTILRDLSLVFDDDRCHALVGINGVGKTSLLLSLTRKNALIRPDGSWQPAMYLSPHDLIAAETVGVARFAGLFRRPAALDRWGLAGVAGQTVQSLSRGEKSKLSLSVAEALDPEVLLLDEPSLGLDLEGQKLLGRLIRDRAEARRMTIVSTHDLSALDTAGCHILYMHREDGVTRVVEGQHRMLEGTADIRLGDIRVEIQGSAATMARKLLEMQTERLR